MENFNRQKAIEECNLGINEKRNSNFSKALEHYSIARSIDPTFSHIYNNSAKILIGLGEMELAFKHLITYAHLNLISPYYNLSQYSDSLISYKWDLPIFEDLYLEKNIVEVISSQNEILKYIVVELNLCANAGICYVYKNKHIIDYNLINLDLFNNYKSILLGQPPNGQIIRDSKYAPMINSLGFLYLIRNIQWDVDTETEVTRLYINDSFIPNNFI